MAQLTTSRDATSQHLWRAALLALLAYAAITVVMFWPLVRAISASFPMDLGDPPNESWIVAWGAHTLATNPTQLLQGNIYFPHPNALAYNDNLLGLLPLATPVFLLSGGNTALTYNVLYLLSFALCGLGAYLLARHLTGSIAGAFLAGLIVAYSPYRMVHLSHLNQLSGQWVLFVLLFWERARGVAEREHPGRMWPNLLALAAFYVLQALCSIYYAVFLATCLVVYLLVYLLSVGWTRARPFVLGVCLAALGAALALLPVLVPYLRLQSRVGQVRGADQVLYFSADLRDFLHMPSYSVLYGWTESALQVPAFDAHQYLFPGLVALVMALIGWRWQRQRPVTRAYGIILLVTVILSLGRQLKIFDRVYNLPLPYALLYDHLPGYHSFRDPARFSYIGFICLALLAAWGLSGLLERLRRDSRLLLAALLCLGALAEYWITPIPTPVVATGNAIPAEYRWLKVQPAHTAVLELPIGQQDAVIWSHQALMTYYATYHWQPIVNGVGGYTPEGYERDAAILNRWPDAASRRLLAQWGVRYVIWHANWVGKAGPRSSATTPLVRHWPDGASVYSVVRK